MLLGGFDARTGAGDPVTLPTRKGQALLAYLALDADRPQPRGKLTALLWERSAEPQARASLRQTLSSLRRALAAAGADVLRADAQSVWLEPGAVQCDAVLLECLLDESTPQALERAASLYGGELLAGFALREEGFEEWLMSERERLRELALEGMERLAESHVEAGMNEAGVRVATRLLALDPLRESGYRVLMRLYAAQGRREAAIEQYRRCRETLRRELDAASAPQTDALLEAVRSGTFVPAESSSRQGASRAEGVEPPRARAAERRQVCALCVRLSSSTGAADLEAEHERLRDVLQTAQGVIRHYGGTSERRLGRSWTALFGAAAAHADDPERALRAATTIRASVSESEMDELEVGFGVVSGEAIVADVDELEHPAPMVTGEPVEEAARLADAAGAGEILMSDAVRRALADAVDAVRVGEDAASPWRLRRFRPEGARLARVPLVGRRRELGQLEGILDDVRARGRGQVVYVRGEAGVGKTRLVEEALASACERGYRCHVARVLDFGTRRGGDAVATATASLLPLVGEGSLEPAHRLGAYDLLDVDVPAELRALAEGMDAAARARVRHEVLTRLIEGAAEHAPLLVGVEDIHWSNEETLEYLATMMRAVSATCAVLVLSARIENEAFELAWRGVGSGAALSTLDLGPLDEGEAQELVACLADDPASAFSRRCMERAAGNPLFLVQLLHSAGEGAPDELPGSLRSLVLARADQLPPVDRRALQVAAVIGQRFSLETLRALMEEPHYRPDALLRCRLVRREGPDYLFAHALIREGIYGALLRADRAELHRRAAAWFAGRDLPLHAEHLERAGDPAAAGAYLAAAREQALEHRYERALELVDRGLAAAGEPAERTKLSTLRGEALHELGSIAESVESYRQALAHARDDAARCDAWVGMADGWRVLDAYDEAFEALARAQSIASGQELAAALSRIHCLRGNLHFPAGNVDACREEHARALEWARRAGFAALEARALSGLGDAEYARGRMVSARERYARCVELCREHGLGRIEVANVAQLAMTYHYCNELGQALRDALHAVEMSTRLVQKRAEVLARLTACFALYELGEPERGHEHLQRAGAVIAELGVWRFEAERRALESKVLRAAGRPDEALRSVHAGLAYERGSDAGYARPLLLGERALLAEDADARRAALAEGERLLAAGAVSHCHLWFYRDAIDASLAAREIDEVWRYAAALDAYTRDEPLAWSDYFAARARALAEWAEGARGESSVQRLCELGDRARASGLQSALPALERALDEAGAAQPPSGR